MKMEVQVSPEVQIYLYLPQSVTTRGIPVHCGDYTHYGQWLGPLVPVKENHNATAYKHFLENHITPILWQKFGESPHGGHD